MQYEFEKNKLYSLLDKNLLKELKESRAYVAGGTITSLFCNRGINDIDIYFRDEESFVDFVSNTWERRKGWFVSFTNKATLIKYNNKNDIQLIHFKYFPKAEDIFDTFDFTVCMGAFDFDTEDFCFHPDFMKHNSQRILKFNKKTAFPIISLMRVQKYKEKGYSISKSEFMRIILTCMNLKIDTYEELKEQMGGMYGVNYDKLLDKSSGEVDIDNIVDAIANLSLDEDCFKALGENKFEKYSLEEYLDDVTNRPIQYLEFNDSIFRIYEDKPVKSSVKPANGIKLDADEYFKNIKFYKFVKKVDGQYSSFFDPEFKYMIGKVAEAKNSSRSDYITIDHPVLYFSKSLKDIVFSPYKNRENKALLEVEIINNEDIFDISDNSVELKRCKVLREVPVQEYEKYLK